MKRPNGEEINPSKEILAPNQGGYAHHAVACPVLQIDHDPEIQMAIVETDNCALGRGRDDRKPTGGFAGSKCYGFQTENGNDTVSKRHQSADPGWRLIEETPGDIKRVRGSVAHRAFEAIAPIRAR